PAIAVAWRNSRRPSGCEDAWFASVFGLLIMLPPKECTFMKIGQLRRVMIQHSEAKLKINPVTPGHHDHSCIRCTAYREFPLSEQNNLSSMNPFIFSFNAETRQHESPFFTPQKLLRCETEFKFIK